MLISVTGSPKPSTNKVLTDFAATHVQKTPQGGLGFGCLVAVIIGNEPHLIEFGTTDFQPEIKQGNLFAVSMGSGQLLADPFLAFVSRVLWKNTSPDVKMGKIGVYWALNHTIKYAPGGVGEPIKIAVLQKTGIDWKAEISDDTQEQAQFIDALEAGIAPNETVESATVSVPPTRA